MASYDDKTQDSLQGVLVQEIPCVTAIQKMEGDADVELANGVMRVLLVTLDISDPFEDPKSAGKARAAEPESMDIWVVLEIGNNFSLPVRASQTIIPQRSSSSYTFPSSDVPGAAISLFLSSTRTSSIDQFEELLTDYCAFQSDSKGRGRIELMDEKGELMGTIEGPWHLEEDEGMHKLGYEKDPVLVELPPDSSSEVDQKVTVSTAPRTDDGGFPDSYQNDWLLKGASLVSKTLVGGSTWAGKKMLNAADSYVSKTTTPPSREGEKISDEKSSSQALDGATTMTTSGKPALTFSPKVHSASHQLKAFSGTATNVSGRTRDAVLNIAGKVGDKVGKTTGIQSQPRADGTTTKPTGIRGVLNRSLLAANVVLDGLTQSAGTLLADGGEASGRVIEHRYGSEAKVISGNAASLGRSAFVVYKDINGVRRKALLKVATGTIKARAPDGSEVILQQEGTHFTPTQAPPTSTAIAPPSYDQDSKSTEKRSQSDFSSPVESAAAATNFDSILYSTRSSSFDYWDLYEAALIPNTPRHPRRSESWNPEFYSPVSTERFTSSPFTRDTKAATTSLPLTPRSSARFKLFEKVQQSPQYRVSLFPRTPTTTMTMDNYDSLHHSIVSFSPRSISSSLYRVKPGSTPSSSFGVRCGIEPIRWMKPRTPSQLFTTVTPRRVMGAAVVCCQMEACDQGGDDTRQHGREGWNVEDAGPGAKSSITRIGEEEEEERMKVMEMEMEDDYSEQESDASPLLKASQESSLKNVDQVLCLGEVNTDLDHRQSTFDTPPRRQILRQPSSTDLLRRMRDCEEVEDVSFGSTSARKKRRLKLKQTGIESESGDPFIVSSSSSNSGMGEQAVDVASILLSIGQSSFKKEESSPINSGNLCINAEEEEEKTNELTSKNSQHESDQGHIRTFPANIPLLLNFFPRLYQRYRVPSPLPKDKAVAVYGAKAPARIKDKELQRIALRGMKTFDTWHEPLDPFDLYTPRWVTGISREKAGLCTICYEQDPSEINWKRTKTSEYNYHLINQHGISPHTHRPYDPPISVRTIEVKGASTGHRKTIIQGKCHVCKKYIDMQGKSLSQVKVPEIYWWKHARRCHKGKEAIEGTGGVFVEDKFYHLVMASCEAE